MSNPLLIALRRIGARRARVLHAELTAQDFAMPSATFFLIMRRMRAPLILLIVVFAVSVAGLALIPGVDDAGKPAHMTLFDAFYVISYTATTIGFGELPWPFTIAQRLWLTISIYLSVVGWAYAIGSVLSLLGDSGFRRAVSLQGFTRKVRRLREPFVLLAGYGQTGRRVVSSFDALNQRVVVLDKDDRSIESLDLEELRADVPGLVADAANPRLLTLAGLGHADCAGVLALTDDEEANLAISITTALLRPDLRVFTRASSPAVIERLRPFGTPIVINPFDVFGDHMRLVLRAPATYQLIEWLASGPGAELPSRIKAAPSGRWVICGFGQLGQRLVEDFETAGLDVTIIETGEVDLPRRDVIRGDAADVRVLAQARLDSAAGVVAGTDNDTTNLSILANARHTNPDLYLVARQNVPANAALFQAMNVDVLLVPAEITAHQVYAQLSTPLLWRFYRAAQERSDDWAAQVIESLARYCGRALPALWPATFDPANAPALVSHLSTGGITMDAALRDPEDRTRELKIVPLLLDRGDDTTLCPPGDTVLEPGDHVLLAGRAQSRRQLELTMLMDSTASYVLFGRRLPESVVWRAMSRRKES